MCNGGCIIFVAQQLPREAIRGKRVIELGSGGFGVRALLEHYGPSDYVGVDIHPGPGVDVVLPLERALERFPEASFDVVVSTETLEHVRDWRAAVHAIKRLAAPGARIVLTTCSQGYPFHGAPFDFWRFEVWDLGYIFSDFAEVDARRDSLRPAVYLTATRPQVLVEHDLAQYDLYSMPLQRRATDVTDSDLRSWTAARARVGAVARRGATTAYDLFRDLVYWTRADLTERSRL